MIIEFCRNMKMTNRTVNVNGKERDALHQNDSEKARKKRWEK